MRPSDVEWRTFCYRYTDTGKKDTVCYCHRCLSTFQVSPNDSLITSIHLFNETLWKMPYCFRVEQPDNRTCRRCREYQNTKNCNERDDQGYSESLWIGEMRFEDDCFSLARNTELLPMYCSSVMNQCMHSSTKDAIWEKQSKFLYVKKLEDLKPISIIYEEHRFRIVKLPNCPKWSWDCCGNLHFTTSNPLSPEKSPRVWFSSKLWVRKALSIPSLLLFRISYFLVWILYHGEKSSFLDSKVLL